MAFPRQETAAAAVGGTPGRTVALAALAGVLPFWSLLVAHVVHGRHGPSGFIVYDMAYYVANGREIFERGNGLGYCNPYDTTADAPVIYYHWLPWVFGAGVKFLHVDPGVWFSLIGLLAGYVCSWATFRLVEAILPSQRFLLPLYLLTMWGGGLFAVAAMAAGLAPGEGLPDVRRFDPYNGWWFLNWGRNLVYTTEAVYHALVAWAWVGVVQRRPWQAAGPVVALAATHPFSGLQHLSIMLGWFTLTVFIPPAWPAAAHHAPEAHRRGVVAGWIMLILTAALFGAYYFLYLPAVPQHAAIARGWAIEWVLTWPALLLAYMPVAVLAAIRCRRDRHHWRAEMSFFVVAAAVSVLLAKHDLFTRPHQPLHFTRGYIWMPLALLALPLVQSVVALIVAHTRPAVATVLLAAAAGLAVLDNFSWLATYCVVGGHDVRLAAADREVFAALERAGARGVLLYAVPNRLIGNYLSATYTAVRPWIGHNHLTPRYDERIAGVQDWIATGRLPELLADVEILVVATDTIYPIEDDDWETLCETTSRRVLRRRARPAAD